MARIPGNSFQETGERGFSGFIGLSRVGYLESPVQRTVSPLGVTGFMYVRRSLVRLAKEAKWPI